MTATSAAELVERLDSALRATDNWPWVSLHAEDANAIRALLLAAPPRHTYLSKPCPACGAYVTADGEHDAALGAGAKDQSAAGPKDDIATAPARSCGDSAATPSALIVGLERIITQMTNYRMEDDIALLKSAREALAEQAERLAESVPAIDADELQERISALEAELAEAKKDAERYRWLRGCKAGQWEWLNNHVRIDKGVIALDEAIDRGLLDDDAVPAKLWWPTDCAAAGRAGIGG